MKQGAIPKSWSTSSRSSVKSQGASHKTKGTEPRRPSPENRHFMTGNPLRFNLNSKGHWSEVVTSYALAEHDDEEDGVSFHVPTVACLRSRYQRGRAHADGAGRRYGILRRCHVRGRVEQCRQEYTAARATAVGRFPSLLFMCKVLWNFRLHAAPLEALDWTTPKRPTEGIFCHHIVILEVFRRRRRGPVFYSTFVRANTPGFLLVRVSVFNQVRTTRMEELDGCGSREVVT